MSGFVMWEAAKYFALKIFMTMETSRQVLLSSPGPKPLVPKPPRPNPNQVTIKS